MITEFSARTGIPVESILGRSRNAHMADAREMYYYILSLNGFRVGEIAELMDRHHATVCCGIKRIKDLLDSKDPAIMKLV
jgi:chromosomal replication initiation ATPase DnaA